MTKRIMVVDSARIFCLQIINLLEGTEYEVAGYCKNGEAALAQYNQVAPDLILMDIGLPGMEGLETAKVILKSNPKTKIIMISGIVNGDIIDKAKSAGAKGIISRSFDRERLMEAFREVLGS